MATHWSIIDGDKAEKYATLLPQVEALMSAETDKIANQANIVAALWQTFGFFWIGFYRVVGEQLVLGPFQGPVACTRIDKGKGVCGAAWQANKTLLVPDVNQFPGHIACASASRSEIVVPVNDARGVVTHVLDIDSDTLDAFDELDRHHLEQLAVTIASHI